MDTTLYIAVQADTSYIKDPSVIRKIIEKQYDDLSALVKDE
jgi:hypothetical protein